MTDETATLAWLRTQLDALLLHHEARDGRVPCKQVRVLLEEAWEREVAAR